MLFAFFVFILSKFAEKERVMQIYDWWSRKGKERKDTCKSVTGKGALDIVLPGLI